MSIERITKFSPDRLYRYTLWRRWDLDLLTGCADDSQHAHEFVQFIGLNPSTADESKDDPTIRRCIAFAKSWGYGEMCMTNLFAWRETDSRKLAGVEKPIGSANPNWLVAVAQEDGLVVAVWGTKGWLHQRQDWAKSNIPNLHCLRRTKDGFPEHPLYLPKTLKPIPL